MYVSCNLSAFYSVKLTKVDQHDPKKKLKDQSVLSTYPKVKPFNIIRCLHCFDSLFIYFSWSNIFFSQYFVVVVVTINCIVNAQSLTITFIQWVYVLFSNSLWIKKVRVREKEHFCALAKVCSRFDFINTLLLKFNDFLHWFQSIV